MKKKAAFGFLTAGILLLIVYLFLVFKTTISVLIVLSLLTSIACNTVALQLFHTARHPRRDEDD